MSGPSPRSSGTGGVETFRNRVCNDCQKDNLETRFPPQGNICSACQVIRRADWRRASRGRDTDATHRRRQVARTGITHDEYDELFADPRCFGCGREGKIIDGRRLTLDHDHETGEVRGTLCWKCNFAVGWARDSPGVLLNLNNYLLAPPFRASRGTGARRRPAHGGSGR